MSRIIILTYLLSSVSHYNCTRRIDYPYEYVLDKDKDDDVVYMERRLADDINDVDYDMTRGGDSRQADDMDVSRKLLFNKSTKTWPYKRSGGLNLIDVAPGLRTDVVVRLQEKLQGSKGDEDHSYKFDNDPWSWPVITLRVKITPLTLPTPPSRTTRTFRDHFLTFKYNMFNRYTTATTKYLPISEYTTAATRDVAPSNSFNWKYNFLSTTTRLPWYLAFKTMHKTPVIFFPEIRTYNVSKKTSMSTRKEIVTKHVNYLRISNFIWPSTSASFNSPKVNLLRGDPDPDLDPDPNSTTTTTTTRTTRTYPHPEWICYECGRNETKFGSSFCHEVFETVEGSPKQHSLHYKCNGNISVRNQCFKRFLDVGHYNERGCRDYPPRRSGKTYVSKRLRALEKMLHDVEDGCTFSPHAALVPFSRSVQLYARFYVCVCKGTLCNNATNVSSQPSLIIALVIILFINSNYF